MSQEESESQGESASQQQQSVSQQVLTMYHNPYIGYRPIKRFYKENEEYFITMDMSFEDVREILQLHSPIYNSKKLKVPLRENKLNSIPFRNMHMDIFFIKNGQGEMSLNRDMKSTRKSKQDSTKSKKKLHNLISESADAVSSMVLVDVPTKFTYARTIKNKSKDEVIKFLKGFFDEYPQAVDSIERLIGDGESAWQDLTMEDIFPNRKHRAPNQKMRLEMEAKGVKNYADLFKRKLYVPSSSRHGAYLAESAIGQIKVLWRDMLLVKKFSNDKSPSILNDTTLESICHIINNRNGSLASALKEPTIDAVLFPSDAHTFRVFNVGDLVHVANDTHLAAFEKKSSRDKFTDAVFEIVSYSYNNKTDETYYRVRSFSGGANNDKFYLQRSWKTDELQHIAPGTIPNEDDYDELSPLFWQKNSRFFY